MGAYSQNNNTDKLTNKTLVELLAQLEKDYQIFFSYNKTIIDDLELKFGYQSAEPIDKILQRLFKQSNLQYQSYSDKYFVIYHKKEKSQEEMAQLQKHFKAIEKIETLRRKTIKKEITKEINQPSTIIGKVIAANGEALVGANIQCINN